MATAKKRPRRWIILFGAATVCVLFGCYLALQKYFRDADLVTNVDTKLMIDVPALLGSDWQPDLESLDRQTREDARGWPEPSVLGSRRRHTNNIRTRDFFVDQLVMEYADPIQAQKGYESQQDSVNHGFGKSIDKEGRPGKV
jgi:hypothetical protein